jgi:hypothetical protein
MKKTNSTGIGISGFLGIAFVVLKLVGVISWSWLWVLAPFWIPLAVCVFILIGIVTKAIIDANREEK